MPILSHARTRRLHSALRLGLRPLRTATAFARLEPTYLLIGGMRCGTTTLHGYLRDHPRIAVADRKEVHYFDVHYARGRAWYLSHFPTIVGHWRNALHGRPLMIGESTANYLYHPAAPERIRKDLPDVRLLILFRDPVDRAYSHYQRSVRIGREDLSLEDAIRLETEQPTPVDDPRHRSYLARGRYAEQVQAWLAHFPRDRFLFLSSDQLFSDPSTACRMVFRFLGLADHDPPRPRRRNAGTYDRMRPETRQWLERYFQPYNEALFEIVGIDYGWNPRPA